VRFIVDSSKDPLWIHDRSQDLIKSGLGVKNVLIWKSPHEYYLSCAKRGEERGWKRRWVHYHRFYFSMVDDWWGVRYSDVSASQEILSLLCQRVAIPYFDGKRNYWEKENHILFGNTSAKVHLYAQGTNRYEQYREERDARLISQTDPNGILDTSGGHPIKKIHLNGRERYCDRIEAVLNAKSVGGIDFAEQRRNTAQWDKGTDEQISFLKSSHLYEKYRRLRRYIEVKSPQRWLNDDKRRF